MSGLLTARLPDGFARAVGPISAGAISTPTDGLIAGEVSIPTGDGEIPGYRAMPEKGKTFPVVLVVQEIFGVHEHIKDVCRKHHPGAHTGRAVWLHAAHTNRVKAGAAWYGQLLYPTNEFRTKTSLDVAGSLKFPVIGLYGGKDAGIPLEQVEAMRKALKTAGSPSEIVVYPDAQHGFNADYRPSHNEADAQDAWRRMPDWFKRFGAA